MSLSGLAIGCNAGIHGTGGSLDFTTEVIRIQGIYDSTGAFLKWGYPQVIWLVVTGTMNFIFPNSWGNFIIPTDEHIFSEG